jgi:hypothetical protein
VVPPDGFEAGAGFEDLRVSGLHDRGTVTFRELGAPLEPVTQKGTTAGTVGSHLHDDVVNQHRGRSDR